MIRVVVDTGVFVSALIGPRGGCRTACSERSLTIGSRLLPVRSCSRSSSECSCARSSVGILHETREAWAGVLALLGGYGFRPKLTSAALVAFRADGWTVTIASDEERLGHEAPFIRHFPPESEPARMTLTAAYGGRYRIHLDALAARGIHAYLESVRGEMRIFSDVSQTLLLDVSIGDEGVPVFEMSAGEWVVFLDTPDGYEAEFTVDRYDDADDDAESLADAVAEALGHVLRDGHIFMQHYDPDFGRLDPSWLRARRP